MNTDENLGEILAEVTAGPYTDPVTGERHILVPDAGERVLKDAALLDAVCAALHREHPGAESTLLRTPPGVEPGAPWRRHLTYVRHTGELPPVPDGPEVSLADGDTDGELVRLWLAQAFTAAGTDMRRPVPEDVALAEAAGLYALPGRVSLLARHEGRTVGHATLLTEQEDETTGEAFVELVDILVDGAPDDRLATAALTRAAAAHAHALGRPLIGNVVHAAPSGPQEAGKDTWRIVTRLLETGWTLDHAYWWAPAPRPEAQP
ncbi:hypothetical protein [Streptomyces acidiscabies]|uniref:N-acetyltransferase domain-containing protein n=1 Tax=Streptomyces acidiscabies TaxID=42234 RepID=A0A0L0JJV5_9ACTN|nr:hypothetical protein [Streptomyces acidiscabies]KND25991.1 hypothetical protein IQ63_37730 [Streptomyces acidiscabies]